MAVVKSFPKTICMWVACLTLAQATIREEAVEDIMERVVDIPNNDRVLNSVLGRLERNRQGLLERLKSRFGENAENCDESEALPEYTESVENPQERGLRHLDGHPSHDRMCQANRTIHRLNTLEYEYRPAYYEEVRCSHTPQDEVGHKEQICSLFGLSCVQWDKTIHLTRRRYTSDCWETKTIIIPAGCECMWPVHKLGAISSYV